MSGVGQDIAGSGGMTAKILMLRIKFALLTFSNSASDIFFFHFLNILPTVTN
jgi:hypothetical protein